MKTNNIFKKMVSGEELSNEEKIEASKWLLRKNDFMPLNEISAEEKIEIARELVAKKVSNVLEKQMIISRLSGKPIDITLDSSQCVDSDANIEKFLAILWAKDINVTHDFPWYCESYVWTTRIKFRF